MNTRRVFTVIVIGLVVGALSVSMWTRRQTRPRVNWLFSNNPQQVSKALEMFRPSPSEPVPLLLREPHLISEVAARLGTLENPTDSVAFTLIMEAQVWDPEKIGESTWCHVLEDLIDQADREDSYLLHSARVNLEELEDMLDDDRPNTRTALLWDSLLDATDPQVRRLTLRSIVMRWPDAPYTRDVIRRVVGDEDPSLRRLGWLLRSHMTVVDPRDGFAMRLTDADPGVLEAMLWAAVVTNPDQAPTVLDFAADEQLCHPDVLGYLRRRTADTSIIAPPLLSDLHTFWHTREPPSSLFDDPVASDGSIWAIVLLADRCLDDDAKKEVALQWLHDLHDKIIFAGALLSLLNGTDIEEIADEARHGGDSLRRLIERLHASPFPYHFPSGRLGERNPTDLLLARMIAGPSGAVDTMLDWESSSAVEHLTTFGWFYERFMPDIHALVAPLNVNDERVAQLQRDLLTTAWWVHRREMILDRRTRQWRQAATIGTSGVEADAVKPDASH